LILVTSKVIRWDSGDHQRMIAVMPAGPFEFSVHFMSGAGVSHLQRLSPSPRDTPQAARYLSAVGQRFVGQANRKEEERLRSCFAESI
jgi:hypothetical protein